jgi:hypothetical protein
MASDRRARGVGVMDTLAEANGSVLAAQWGEAALEHGGGVGGVVCMRWVVERRFHARVW